MVTPFSHSVFVETPDYQFHLDQGYLTIHIKEQTLIYVIVGADRQLKYCKAVHNTQQLSLSLFLRFAFEKEPLLRGWDNRCHILSSSPSFALVPKSLIQKKQETLYAQLFLQDTIYDDEVYHFDFAQEKIRCIFLSPPHIHHVLQEYLGAYTFRHVAHTIFEMGSLLSGKFRSHMLIQYLGEHIVVAIFNQGQFVYCNSFEYRTESGLLYFLKSLVQQFQIEASFPIFLMGDLDPSNPVFEYLLKNFPSLSFPHILEEYFPNLPTDIPYWKFCYLLFT